MLIMHIIFCLPLHENCGFTGRGHVLWATPVFVVTINSLGI